jgi:hypothetical protein
MAMWGEVDPDSDTSQAEDLVDDFDRWATVADESVENARLLPRARMTFEGVLGLLAAFFIGLPAPLMAGVTVAHLVPGAEIVLGVITFVVTGYLSILVVRLAARATEGDSGAEGTSGKLVSIRRMEEIQTSTTNEVGGPVVVPLAIAMAIRLPRWNRLIRPFVAIWWLAHFAAAAFLGHGVASIAARGLNNAGWMLSVPLTLLATFAFLFAGNLYLMLAVAACVRRPGVWLIVWRHRFFVDLVLAAFLLFAGP